MLRFIFGASGAGKSTTLYREIIEWSVAEPDRLFVILVPDQFTMQTQLDVVKAHPDHGIMNIDVLSFSRLTHRMFDEQGVPREKVLDDLGKSLVLRHVAAKRAGSLPVLGAGMRRAGFVDEVKSTLSEFMQYDIRPEHLTELVNAASSRKALAAKLRDLQTLYAAFEDYIRERYMTPEDTLEKTAGKIRTSRILKDAVVALDGFTGFTPVQYRVLRALYDVSEEMIVTVTVSSETDPYTPDMAGAESLFALSKKTVRDLSLHIWNEEKSSDPQFVPEFDIWEQDRRKRAGDIFLPDNPVIRLKDAPALAFLERRLFRFGDEAFDKALPCDAVSLSMSSTVREEVRQTFRRIRAMLREDESLQYRDFAIICALPEEYEDAIARVAADFDIPVYQDKTNNIRLNPLIEYLRSITEIIRTGFSAQSMFHYFRCGLAPYERQDTDYLENYVRANGISGKKAWMNPFVRAYRDNVSRNREAEEALYERVEKLRALFASRFGPVLHAIEEKADVKTLTRALCEMMNEDGVHASLAGKQAYFAEAGDDVRAAEYRQIMDKLMLLFERVVTLLGDVKMTFDEYADVLEAGFSEITVGSIPQSADRVMAGDLTRTRLKEVKYLFLLGASDKAIPGRADSGGLLSESDRDFLRQHAPDVELAPSPLEQTHIERLYLYMTLTKPSRAIRLSCAWLDAEKKSVRPSYLINRLAKLFPGVRMETPEEDDLIGQAETAADTDRQLAHMIRAYADGTLNKTEEMRFLSAYGLRARENRHVRLLREAAFPETKQVRLPGWLAHDLYDVLDGSSVSRLERFSACAFAHFVLYGLRIREQAEYDFDAADLGNVFHGVLETFSRKLAEKNADWDSFTDEEGEAVLDEALTVFAASYGGAVLYDSPRRQQTLKRVRRVLWRTIRTLRYQIAKGLFKPVFAEKPFVKEVVTAGHTLRFYGRIDRVDLAKDDTHEYVKVIDFKSGRYDFDITRLYHGLQIQLLMYMDAMIAERREKQKDRAVIPAAMLYYRVTDPVISTDDDKPGKEADKETIANRILRELRTTGIVNADETVIRLMDRDFMKTSDVIPVSFKSNGALSATSAVFAEEDYEALAAHMGRVVQSLCDKMTEGVISVSPYALGKMNACTYCAYQSICGFDVRRPDCSYRELAQMKLEEALALIKKEEK